MYISPSRLRLQRHDCVDMGHVLLVFQHFHPMSCTLGEGNAHTPTRTRKRRDNNVTRDDCRSASSGGTDIRACNGQSRVL